MWHFCLALDPLHLCTERGFDTSQGSYMLLKWPLGQARDEKKNLRPGPGSSSSCISTASVLGQRFQAVSHGSGTRFPGKSPWESKDQVIVPTVPLTSCGSLGEVWLLAEP